MKGHHIFNLFLLMLTVIFVAGYFDKFENIETFFMYLFSWMMIGFPMAIFIGWLIGLSKDKNND